MTEQRYRVLQRLEAGGMAEVFVGEAVSVQGFKKKVAIKRVLPHLAKNKNFIGMFLDEARLGARLNHANIVTVFDIGAADNTYFIVMEFVDGANLKSVIEALRGQGQKFPMKDAIYICMEACRGLSYAHELIDEGGEPLNLVHRDVSPPNILISRRGEIKVTDFGLAKATTQLEKTDPGVVKGKFSYLSPEAAQAKAVDARADIFALGIVLWEMLAGRRLFLGETDYQTVKLVEKASIPSLNRLNADVDEAFEGLLHKALSRDPEERFQSAREFGDALAGYLFSHQMKVTSYDIANLLKDCLAPPETKKLTAIDQLISEELVRFTSIEQFEDEEPLDSGAKPLSPEDVADGASPLDLAAFENPAEWFTDDLEIAAALEEHSADGDDNHEDSMTGNLARLLEDDTGLIELERRSNPDISAGTEELGNAETQPAIRVEETRQSVPSLNPEVIDSGDNKDIQRPSQVGAESVKWLYGLIALFMLVCIGAAAYFGGLF